MNIKKAKHLGMCFGVKDAINLAKDKAQESPLSILGQLVHNSGVVADLARRGIASVVDHETAQTPSLMITAHGTSDRKRKELRQSSFAVHDATCPLVHHAHRALQRLVTQGCHPVVIGVAGHIEVEGLIGDFDDASVVLTSEDIQSLPPKPRYGVVSQTTQPIDRVRRLVAEIERCHPDSEVHFQDTVCQPTKNRQQAALDLAAESDVMIVIGGKNSNNTRELLRTCSTRCDTVHHVQGPEDLEEQWFHDSDRVGVTAGTSTPDQQVDMVIKAIEQLDRRRRETRSAA